jgi:adenine-specific DNA-methyltransferase
MNRKRLRETLLEHVPSDGATIGNGSLRDAISEQLGRGVDEDEYAKIRDELVEEGLLVRGPGRGGSVRLAKPARGAEAGGGHEVLVLKHPEPKTVAAKKPSKPAVAKAPPSRASTPKNDVQVLSYRHSDRRKNNPEVGIVDPDTDPEQPKTKWVYDPHIDPALQMDIGRAQVEKLVDDALASGSQDQMRAALEQLRRMAIPYLNWTGKAERTSFEVDTVSLHVHERVDAASILHAVRKRLKGEKSGQPKMQLGLFSAAFENLPLRDAVDFYKHDKGWSNRLIAGDSLLVMNSLLQKEGMAGQVQMIYIDPPYGIRYGSNFQPFVGKRDVADRKDEDLTQEPEMIKAFRDTWELGIHSYLTYLRDRLLLGKELLHESGSVFVQISDENLHHVRELLDEIFGADNFVSQITFSKTSSATVNLLPSTADYILWAAKNKQRVKFNPLFLTKELGGEGADKYDQAEEPSGRRRKLSRDGTEPEGTRVFRLDNLMSQSEGREKGPGAACWFPVQLDGREFLPNEKNRWKTNEEGMRRLLRSRRLHATTNSLAYVRFIDDFPAYGLTNVWSDVGGIQSRTDAKVYVVQTAIKAIERCMLMATDPGDLVLDPTCGSGSTAYVAEKWGRRWITCDTSRVAVTLAKQRLMTASYDYYELKHPHEGLKGGFVYKTVPHIMLSSIASNPEVDEIYERIYPAIEDARGKLNAALKKHPPGEPFKVDEGTRKGQLLDFRKGAKLEEWDVPYTFPAGWPEAARSAFDTFHSERRQMQHLMNASTAAHAEQETLYDQPRVAKDKLRITGPFTVEAVPFPTVFALDEARPADEADVAIARSGETYRQHQWRDELLKTGIRGKGGQMLKLVSLETLPNTRYVHGSGALADTGERVVVSFGPEHGALEQRQVEMAMREAGELFPRPKMIVFCAFVFDPEAAKDIDQTKGIVALKVQMNTDLLTEDLKKARASNQSFWLMGQPDVEVRTRQDGLREIEVHGFDYFDTVKGELVSGGKSKIAVWLLDTDYDERSLFPRQVFFPMAGAKDGWNKLRKDLRAELDESRLAEFHGTVSLPFEPGENRKVAVKVVDDRGIESLKVIPLD